MVVISTKIIFTCNNTISLANKLTFEPGVKRIKFRVHGRHSLRSTVELILVNDQLDVQFFFLIYLFKSSTCFEQTSAHHQENHLYQYNVWYKSIRASGRLVCRSGSFSWWWALGCSKHVEYWNKYMRKNNCESSWSFTRIIPRPLSTKYKKNCRISSL
jgi:hypothetical protein